MCTHVVISEPNQRHWVDHTKNEPIGEYGGASGGMGMGMMNEMGCMEMMHQDPQLMGHMMELRGEMMREGARR